jgi:hypothetical protein
LRLIQLLPELPREKERTVSYATLIDTLLQRRSRRFGRGMEIQAGPLAFDSNEPAVSLTLEQEALMAFAAVGITGVALGEMEYTSGHADAGGGNLLAGFVGRTAASADALQSVALVVINDGGTWYIPRPQDLSAEQVAHLVRLGHDRRFTEWYEQIRVPIAAARVTLPMRMPFTAPFNRWDTNQPGTTVFLPVIETSAFFINSILTALSEEMGIYIIDDGKDETTGLPFKPAGLFEFARSNPTKPGHLHSDKMGEIGFVLPLTLFESTLLQCVSAEAGGILQNLGLMAQALGLGGFPHAAQHPEWLKQLGFDETRPGFREMMGVGDVPDDTLASMGYAEGVPTFTSDRLMRCFCPPVFKNMSDAVDAFVATKYGPGGVFRGGARTAWKNSRGIEDGIAPYSDNAIAATKSYCEYVFDKYQRFPTLSGPITTLLAFQAHQIDRGFYRRFYGNGVLPSGGAATSV